MPWRWRCIRHNLPRDRMKLRRLSRTDILRRTLPQHRLPDLRDLGCQDMLYRGVASGWPASALAPGVGFRWLRLRSLGAVRVP